MPHVKKAAWTEVHAAFIPVGCTVGREKQRHCFLGAVPLQRGPCQCAMVNYNVVALFQSGNVQARETVELLVQHLATLYIDECDHPGFLLRGSDPHHVVRRVRE